VNFLILIKEMEEYKFYCVKCDKGFDYEIYYKRHLESSLHLTGKRKPRKDIKEEFECNKCGYKTKNINNYRTHNLNNHSTQKEKEEGFKYYCKSCDFGVFTESLYNKHLKTKTHLMKIK